MWRNKFYSGQSYDFTIGVVNWFSCGSCISCPCVPFLLLYWYLLSYISKEGRRVVKDFRLSFEVQILFIVAAVGSFLSFLSLFIVCCLHECVLSLLAFSENDNIDL